MSSFFGVKDSLLSAEITVRELINELQPLQVQENLPATMQQHEAILSGLHWSGWLLGIIIIQPFPFFAGKEGPERGCRAARTVLKRQAQLQQHLRRAHYLCMCADGGDSFPAATRQHEATLKRKVELKFSAICLVCRWRKS